jgi:hypothetical protein
MRIPPESSPVTFKSYLCAANRLRIDLLAWALVLMSAIARDTPPPISRRNYATRYYNPNAQTCPSSRSHQAMDLTAYGKLRLSWIEFDSFLALAPIKPNAFCNSLLFLKGVEVFSRK